MQFVLEKQVDILISKCVTNKVRDTAFSIGTSMLMCIQSKMDFRIFFFTIGLQSGRRGNRTYFASGRKAARVLTMLKTIATAVMLRRS